LTRRTVEPGALTTRVVSGAKFRVTAPGTTTGNGFDMEFVTGVSPTIDQSTFRSPRATKR
jgi:hypothetical protein